MQAWGAAVQDPEQSSSRLQWWDTRGGFHPIYSTAAGSGSRRVLSSPRPLSALFLGVHKKT